MMRPDGHLGGNTMNLTVIADFEDNGAKSATRPPLSVALSLANRVAAQDLVTLGNPLTGCHTAASVRPPVSVFSIYLHTSHANQHTPCPDACQTPPPARSTSLTTHPPFS